MEVEKAKSWIYKCLAEKKSDFSPRSLAEGDIKDFTNEFLSDLRTIFEHFIKAFNEIRQEGCGEVAGLTEKEAKEKFQGSLFLYDLADKPGFMLFRKGYRLIFSYIQPGRVRVQFMKQKPFSETENFVDAFINAITNETMSINWVHENHKGFVDINILARYYMKRFLQEI